MLPTLHILSCPYSPVNIDNKIDAFAIAVVKFIDNMSKLGWDCIHYGINGSRVNCEIVQCLPELPNSVDAAITQYNTTAGIEIAKRKKAGDFVLCFYGCENQLAASMNPDLVVIEPSIGYSTKAVFAPYRVFVSHAQRHFYYGERGMLMNPSWTDAVIPNAITPEEFEYSYEKSDYFLFFGRVIESKGIRLAIQATEQAGVKLVIAGPGSLSSLGFTNVPKHVTEFGIANAMQRRTLMKYARAIIAPTLYVEPFGNMVVEGYMSGTPAITTDWGGFTETVIQDRTGYRCKTEQEFVDAIKNVDLLDKEFCRTWAESRFNEREVHDQYDKYFKYLISSVK
jgi:glycosyltransferase involved in cell wall biosynthesis